MSYGRNLGKCNDCGANVLTGQPHRRRCKVARIAELEAELEKVRATGDTTRRAVAAQVADADIIICGLLVEIEGGDAFDHTLVAAWIDSTRETILSLDEDAERSIARHVVETWKAPTPVVPRERLADLTLGRITEEDEEG